MLNRLPVKQAVKQYVFNNFICKFGQKKDGVQFGGAMILNSNVMKRRTFRNTPINTIDIKDTNVVRKFIKFLLIFCDLFNSPISI
jgi:hypothetical protein